MNVVQTITAPRKQRSFEQRQFLTVPTFWFILAVIFIKAFFKTIQKEWHGIDQLRMDKFYLVRHVLKGFLELRNLYHV